MSIPRDEIEARVQLIDDQGLDQLDPETAVDVLETEEALVAGAEGAPVVDQVPELPMDDDELHSILCQEVSHAAGNEYADDELLSNRSQALDYYYQRPMGNEVEGRSQVISPDVANAVDSTLAEVLATFHGERVVEFDPENPGDEQAARAETEAVNWMFFERCGGYRVLHDYVKDALLQRNGVAKVYWCEREEVTFETHRGVPPMMLQQLLAPRVPGERVEVVEREALAPSQGMPSYSIKLRRTTPASYPKIEVCPPEEFLVNEDHGSLDLTEARFVGHVRRIRRGDLIAMGFDEGVVNELPSADSNTKEDARARARTDEELDDYAPDHSSERIKVYECWTLIDADRDGRLERLHTFHTEGKLLSREQWQGRCPPFAAGTSFIMPHRFFGTSLFDKLRQVQDVKTALLRQTIDNGFLINNQRYGALEGAVNLDDMMISRPGGIVRMSRPDALFPLPVQNLSNTGFSLLEYMDKVRQESSGAAIDTAAQAMAVTGDTAHGVERVMSSIEKISALVSRTLAETGIKTMFLLLHEMMMTYQDPMVARVNGEWVPVDPSQWRSRSRVSVNVGQAAGERSRNIAALESVLAKYAALSEQGQNGILMNDQGVYKALVDFTRVSGLDNPEQYWLDPNSPEAQQKKQLQAQQTQQAQAAQQQLIQAQQKVQESMVQVEGYKATIRQQKEQIDAIQKANEQAWEKVKFYEEQGLKYTELELEHNTDIPGQGMEGGANA